MLQAGEGVMLEESNVEQMIFLVRGRAIVTRRGVQVGDLPPCGQVGETRRVPDVVGSPWQVLKSS